MKTETKYDISRIVPHMIKPNDLVLLNFPDGFIPIRALRNEFFNYVYDPVNEGQIPSEVPASTSTDGIKNNGFIQPELLKSGVIAAQPINVFRTSSPSTLFQVFVGIAPSYARIFYAIPAASAQRNIDVVNWSVAYSTVGFIDGYTSPLLCPAPESEFIVPPQIDPAIGYANVLQEPIRPLLWFYVNRVKFGVVTDPELILEMLDKRGRGVYSTIKNIGGITAFTYQYREVFRILPIEPADTREEIIKKIRGVR